VLEEGLGLLAEAVRDASGREPKRAVA